MVPEFHAFAHSTSCQVSIHFLLKLVTLLNYSITKLKPYCCFVTMNFEFASRFLVFFSFPKFTLNFILVLIFPYGVLQGEIFDILC